MHLVENNSPKVCVFGELVVSLHHTLKLYFMATIYLTLSTKVDKTNKQEILIRFSHGKINQRAKTNIFIIPD